MILRLPVRNLSGLRVCAFGMLAALPCVVQAEPYTYLRVLQRVLERDAALDVAGRRVERAQQEIARVESQLGWNANARAAVTRDTSIFGTPTDRAELAAGADRRLSSGATFGLAGSYVREDATTVFSPALPNPSDSTRFDLSLRQPLARGAGNPDYTHGRIIADAGTQAAAAERAATRDALARRVADVFFSALFLRARLAAAQDGVDRAQRLRQYVEANVRLGVAEDKDRLQAQAQLEARIADRDVLAVAWEQQRTALNRLLERPWDAPFEPIAPPDAPLPPDDARLDEEVQTSNPDVARLRAQIAQAEATLERARNAARDQLDLVGTLGARNLSGEAPVGGRVDRSEAVGGLRLEWSAALDDRGLQAQIRQAYLDRAIAQRQLQGVEDDLRYQLRGLLAEIAAAQSALTRRRAHLAAERAKVDEAVDRYRRGRADTAQLVQFENDWQVSSLAADQQTFELARRRLELEILRGSLWQHLAGGVP